MKGSPWDHLGPDLTHRLREHLPQVAADITAAVAAEVPAYTTPLAGALGARLRAGVMDGLSRFLDLSEGADPVLGARERHFYRTLGGGELREHRDLQTLLAAYRVGTRVAFRQLAEALAEQPQVPPGAIISLAEALFAYMDEVSATSAQGYADEQSLRAGEHERLRQELLAVLLSAAADGPALTKAATAARWPLPSRAVVVMASADLTATRTARWGPDALLGHYQTASVAVMPAPETDADHRALLRTATGCGAVISPARSPAHLHTVLNATCQAYDLLTDRIVTGDPLLVDEHLAMLILQRDRVLTRALIANRLAPLASVKPSTRTRLAQTLLSWLRHRGEWQNIAAELHVHPQTVGYRLTQLRTLFGPDLDDPTARFELQMALHADPRLRAPNQRPAPPVTRPGLSGDLL